MSDIPPFASFSEHAQQAMRRAQNEAESTHLNVSTNFLLLSLMEEKDSLASKALQQMGYTISKVRELVEAHNRGVARIPVADIRPTRQLANVVKNAKAVAAKDGSEKIGSEHLLMGLAIGSEIYGPSVGISFGLGIFPHNVSATLKTIAAEGKAKPLKNIGTGSMPFFAETVELKSSDTKGVENTTSNLLNRLLEATKKGHIKWGKNTANYDELSKAENLSDEEKSLDALAMSLTGLTKSDVVVTEYTTSFLVDEEKNLRALVSITALPDYTVGLMQTTREETGPFLEILSLKGESLGELSESMNRKELALLDELYSEVDTAVVPKVSKPDALTDIIKKLAAAEHPSGEVSL